MAEPIGALRVELSASAARFEADMKKARAAAKDAAGGMSLDFSKLAGAAGASATAIGKMTVAAAAGGAAVYYLTKKALDAVDAIGDMAQATGLSVSAYQELAYAAAAAGVDQETFNKSLIKLTTSIADAKKGTGPLNEALKDTNPTLLNLIRNSGGTEEALYRILDAADRMGSVFERNKFLVATFGKAAGPELIQMLGRGSDFLEKSRAQAQAYGAVLGDDVVENAGKAKDQLAALEYVIKQKLIGAVATFSPQILELANRFLEGLPTLIKWVEKMGEWFGLIEKSNIAKLEDDLAAVNEELKIMTNSMNSPVDNFFRGPEGDARLLAKAEEAMQRKIDLEVALQKAREKANQPLPPPPSYKLPPGDSSSNADDATKIAKVTEAYKSQAAAALLAAADAKILAEAQKEGIKDIEALRAAILPYLDALETQKAIAEEQKVLDEQDKDRKETAKKLIEDTRTETERLTEETAKLYAMKQTLIDLLGDEARANEVIKRGIADLNGETDKAKDFAKDLGLSFSSAFEDAIAGGKGLREILQGILSDIIRIAARKAITEPLLNSVTPLLTSLGTAVFSAHGNAFSGGRVVPFAKGGITSGPMMFPLSGGKTGVAGEAGTEAILPLTRIGGDLGVKTDGMGGAGVSVTVINASGQKAKTEESQAPGGGRDIRVIIGDVVATDIRTGGPVYRSIRQTFSASPKATGR